MKIKNFLSSRNQTHILLGAATLIAIWVFMILIQQPHRINGYQLIAIFDTANGLSKGAEVRLNGVLVGEVTQKKINADYQAVVTLDIQKGIQLTEDSVAFIQTDGLFGDKYVQISIGGSENTLENGDEFEFTQGSADIEALAREVIRRIKKD